MKHNLIPSSAGALTKTIGMFAEPVRINWEPELVLDIQVEFISKATLVELGKKKTIKEEER